MHAVRLDKWLWATRLFKTRPLAIEACRGGHVTVDGHEAKPSRDVRPGQIVVTKLGPLRKVSRVLAVTEARMPAKDVPQFIEDLTPAEEYERVKQLQTAPTFRPPPGMGRPTKKQRRSIEQVMIGLESAAPDF